MASREGLNTALEMHEDQVRGHLDPPALLGYATMAGAILVGTSAWFVIATVFLKSELGFTGPTLPIVSLASFGLGLLLFRWERRCREWRLDTHVARLRRIERRAAIDAIVDDRTRDEALLHLVRSGT